MAYLSDGLVCDDFTKGIAEKVANVKNNKALEVEYMTMMMKEMEKYEEDMERGRKEGREEGREEGLKEGLIGSVKDGLLALSEVTRRAGMSEEAFGKLIN